MKRIFICAFLMLLCISSVSVTGCKSNNEKEITASEVSVDELSLRSWSIGEIRETLDGLVCPVEDIDFRTEESDESGMVCFKTSVTFSGSSDEIYSIMSDLCALEKENLFAESLKADGDTEKMRLLAVISNPTAKAGSALSGSEAREHIRSEWACIDRSALVSSFIKLHSKYRVKTIESALMPDSDNRVEIDLSADFTTSAEFLSYQKAVSEDGSFEIAAYEGSGTPDDAPDPSYHSWIKLITDKFNK